MVSNKGIIPEVTLVPEAQPRRTKNREVLFPLATMGHKHILMGRSEAEGPNFYQNRFIFLKFGPAVANAY